MYSDNPVFKRYRIHIKGMVQGIGFRPFVYNLAKTLDLNGYVLNDSIGVLIDVEGERTKEFLQKLKSNAPTLARIDDIIIEELPQSYIYKGFEIKKSISATGGFSPVQPDIAACPDCLKELNDPNDRRYLYPFINCTNCGPRYSIIFDMPYDRHNTTMSSFRMCRECEEEYNNPLDRRFHAQPNACPKCGPRLEFRIQDSNFKKDDENNPTHPPLYPLPSREGKSPSPLVGEGWGEGGFSEQKEKPIETTTKLLKQGAIIAIKGIGGFHLACDACNDNAVKRLREKKDRGNKPFAVMMPDIETIKMFCKVSPDEEMILKNPSRPIALLKKKKNIPISNLAAPENNYLGAMLPYAPLHYLLFHKSLNPDLILPAVVMTSGNLKEEPIVIDNEKAMERLSKIADAFLMHNRNIYMRVDDSVVNMHGLKPAILRRSRGFVPEPIDMGPIDMNEDMPEILACGGQLKNTFCITKGRYAIVSQHIGDMENKEAIEFYKETLKNLKNTFKAEPKIIAHDMHPNYWTTRFAKEYHSQLTTHDSQLIAVQHHHAHIVSCMTEHNLKDDVIGIAFDGTGYGADGNIWGGEFLIADRKGSTRFAHFDYVPMPGGAMAIKEPWRMAISYLINTYGDNAKDVLPLFFNRFKTTDIGAIIMMMKKKFNSPLTSSCGRLFDAVSSLIGIKDIITFEGEAAIKLEMLADSECYGVYKFNISDKNNPPIPPLLKGGKGGLSGQNPKIIDTKDIIKSIVEDIKANAPSSIISAKFHNTIAEIAFAAAEIIQKKHGIDKVAFSGGVFQNSFLVKKIKEKFASANFKIFFNEKIPTNDGGISLGQAVIAAEICK
ncbi:MAG: carbamoyltransferase HypF [Deltaproteobacteria bacterium]|nr:carbamoyltransferase HypF [Deltaproteobacteria bacterium]